MHTVGLTTTPIEIANAQLVRLMFAQSMINILILDPFTKSQIPACEPTFSMGGLR
jgi:hypothetical protein